jgi:hypothetical protein
MDETAVTVNGTRVSLEGPDFRAKLAAELTGKPKIAGETVPFIIMRSVKMNKVALAVLALRDAKAKEVTIRGPRRDGSTGELGVSFPAPETASCSAVMAIDTNVTIVTWEVGGGGQVHRYAKGMAGPDTTLGSQGFAKSIAACDSPVALLAGAESISWGLVFDVALAAREAAKPGSTRGQRFVLLPDPGTYGRKVTLP